MKIAILTSGILPVPAVQGGAVENLIDFYMEYNEQYRLHDITIYCVDHPAARRHQALLSTVNHYHFVDTSSLKAKVTRKLREWFLPKGDYYNNFIEYFFEQAYKDLRQHHYDCIILENRPGYACKLSQRGYSNLILHLHNDLLNSDTSYAKSIFKSLKKVVTVSDYIKQRVETIPNNQQEANTKVVSVHNGINLQQFRKTDTPPLTRTSIGFSDDDFVMVYSGRINKDKGISELIDALLQLDELPKVKLMVLGSSFFDNVKNEDAFIRSLKEKAKGIQEKIVFTGFVPYYQVPNYLQLADIAVLPSMWDEPFGLTIVEAMAVGLPLITTRSGGITEICRGVATIVEREDVVNKLKDAIIVLYNHPEKREQMAAASLEHAQLFDKNRYARDFFNALVPIS